MIIYQVTNKITGKIYIGLSSKYNTNEEFQKSRYWGGGTYIRSVIRKYGKTNFSRKILIKNIFDLEELCRYEMLWINKKNSRYPTGYNISFGGEKPLVDAIPWNKGKIGVQSGIKGAENHLYGKPAWNLGIKVKNTHTLELMRLAKLGKPGNRKGIPCSKKSIDKMKKTKKDRHCGCQKYEFIDPYGNAYLVEDGIKKFTKQYKLRYDSIFQLLRGEIKDYHGWTVKKIFFDK